MCLSVISALTGRRVRKEVAMTGEITLRGKILPVGGIKEKVLAAHRYGLTHIILPRQNEQDLDEIAEEVKSQMTFILVDNIDQVLDAALLEKPKATKKRK